MSQSDLAWYQTVLWQALAEPVGLLLTANDPQKARQRLYAARQAAQDPDLDRLQIRMVDFDGGQIAIVKGALMPQPEWPRVEEPPMLGAKDLEL